MLHYPEPLVRLISELKKLPTIGPKTAQRLAFYMTKLPDEETTKLARAISDVKNHLSHCTTCGNITDRNPCNICTDTDRDRQVICVIEEPDDLLAIERTNEYKGVYHTLMGVLSPLDGVGPKDIKIDALLKRIHDEDIREVIVATNYTTQGQATALYLKNLLEDLGISITRIAYGIPAGGDLEYIDQVTLARALEGRREI